jgi:hypothetical protein
MNNKEIIIPIFNNEYKVIVCWGDVKYIGKILKSWHHDNDSVLRDMTDRRGVCFYAKDCHPVIALSRKPQTPEEIGTLAHEAVHAIRNIFEKIQEESSDEVYAHCVGAVVRETLKNKTI